MFPAPRGRPPKGCVWNPRRGGWDDNDGAASRLPSASATKQFRAFSVRIAPPTRPVVAHVYHNQDSAAVEEAADVDRPTESDLQQKELEERKRKELAPRNHAIWCATTVPADVPVYYLDTLGNFTELGKERVSKSSHSVQPPSVKRVRWIEVQVWGPDKTRNLEEGEWEMEDRLVTYYESA